MTYLRWCRCRCPQPPPRPPAGPPHCACERFTPAGRGRCRPPAQCATAPDSIARRRELGALAVLRQLADPEAVEEHLQVALDGVDAQEQRLGDLAVGGGPRERVLEQRAAEREQHAPLGLRELRPLVLLRALRRRQHRLRRPEQQPRAPDGELVAVDEPHAPAHAMSVHERSVAREPVVDERPVAAGALEDRVHAGDLGVPRQRDLARRAAADVHQRRLARERDDPLAALAVAEQHVRRAGALGRQPVDDLAGGLGTQRGGRGFHGATLRPCAATRHRPVRQTIPSLPPMSLNQKKPARYTQSATVDQGRGRAGRRRAGG